MNTDKETKKDGNLPIFSVMGSLTSEQKRGLQIALTLIKKQSRFDIEWEWISEQKDGQYIKIDEITKQIIELLNCP